MNSPELNLDNLKALKILGKGAMGTVFLVHDLSSDPSANFPFALKIADKNSFLTKLDAGHRAHWEISVLRRLSPPNTHPFLPHLIGSFETADFLCWAVPYCPGGDLNVLRYRQNDRVFSPAVIRFYLAEIVCALDFLHCNGIAYRDLKPENVLIQQTGHVTLTDFDLSRELKPKTIKTLIFPEPVEPVKSLKKAKSARVNPVSRRNTSCDNGERSNSFVGTEEYVSPEVIRGDGHDFAVDWWALGILSYEMLYGMTPFKGNNRKETFRNVLVKTPAMIGKQTALTDLIGRLLEKDPRKRLGYNGGACEIKEHVFFDGVRWDLLTEVLRPPYIPSAEDGKLTTGGMDIGAYFQNLRTPPLVSPSPPPSPSYDSDSSKVSLTEF